jgi:hypothetical protein
MHIRRQIASPWASCFSAEFESGSSPRLVNRGRQVYVAQRRGSPARRTRPAVICMLSDTLLLFSFFLRRRAGRVFPAKTRHVRSTAPEQNKAALAEYCTRSTILESSWFKISYVATCYDFPFSFLVRPT